MKFVWNDEYNIGNEVIDDEHRQLFDQVAVIVDLLANDSSNETRLDEAIEGLIKYAKDHFADEEEQMRVAGVDQRHQMKQKMEHQSFMYDLGKLHGISVGEEAEERYERLLSFAANWLVFHTLQTDQLLGVQLRAIEAGKTPAEAFDESQAYGFGPTINRPVVEALVHLWSGAMGTVHLLESRLQKLEAKAP